MVKLNNNQIVNSNNISQLKIEYSILGASKKYISSFQPMTIPAKNISINDKGIIPSINNILKMDFISYDERTKQIKIKPGTWDIYDKIIIPEGYLFTASSGTKINLLNQSFILSLSPIKFIATLEDPIIIDTYNNQGKGMSVINADGLSIIKHVEIHNQTNLDKFGWNFTGSVNFFK